MARYPPIESYALITDCRSAALVGKTGSIDWCCMPRMDAASSFGRLLDWEKGGSCEIRVRARDVTCSRRYRDHTMVLETRFVSRTGEARLTDFFSIAEDPLEAPSRLVRIVDGVRGRLGLTFTAAPRFDYGSVAPWIRLLSSTHTWAAIGGSQGLLMTSEAELRLDGRHTLTADFDLHAGDRVRFSMTFVRPEVLDAGQPAAPTDKDLDSSLDVTSRFWESWTSKAHLDGSDGPAAIRSAIVLKALSNAATGAIAAAATTSLPERPGGERNFDYRFSWIRDSVFSVGSLTEIGCDQEANEFTQFVQRSAAGSGESLQILYGLGGERTVTERTLPHLEGYRRSRPVRVGNAAAEQLQLGAYGELVRLAWQWHRRGHSPSDDYWRFLADLIDTAAERWTEADRGIWEIRGKPKHFVHSKAMCWVALDLGVALAKECLRKAPVRRWLKTAREIRAAVDQRGFDRERGCFVQAFGGNDVDAALLLLPINGYIAFSDPRMQGTVRAIQQDLEESGFVTRYRQSSMGDGFRGSEGRFLACSFWLAECLAEQGNVEEARRVFDIASATGNDVGLLSEEFDPHSQTMLGNFPQALTHLSHIQAAVSLSRAVARAAAA